MKPHKNHRQQIMSSHLYQTGNSFTPATMADQIGATSSQISTLMANMEVRGDLVKVGQNAYRKPMGTHWAFRIPMSSNPPRNPWDRAWK